MTENSLLGKGFPRPDAPDKVAGRAQYIHDLSKPGMLYGKIKYSDFAHARISHINTQKAEKLPGVYSIITAANTPEIRIGFYGDNLVLKKDKVRQFRDEIAAVAAIDPETAQEAVDLIEVEYEELTGIFSPEEALKENAPLIHDFDPQGRPKTDNIVPVPWRFTHGDVEQAKQESAYQVEDYFETPVIQHACIGTSGCLAEFDLNHNLQIMTKTQIPFLAQRDFNRLLNTLGLQSKNTRVIVPTLGGAFGSGLDTHAYEFIAILLAYFSSKPVKIVFNREEEFTAHSPRQPSKTHIIQGCSRDGKLTFREINMLLDNGAYTSWGATTPNVMMLPISSLYHVPNIHYETTIVYTNNTYCQAMRGYGNPQATWAIESNLDHLAEQVGLDPYEFRRLNSNQPFETTPMGLKVTSCGLNECLQKVADNLDWKEKKSQNKANFRGVGMASLFHTGGAARVYRSDASGVILKFDDFGHVSVLTGGVEMGQGHCAALSVATAEALGISPEKVNVIFGDTAICPWDVGTHASRGAFTACKAIIMAAEKARTKLFELSAEHFLSRIQHKIKKMKKKDPSLSVPDIDSNQAYRPEDFDLKDNTVFLKNDPDNPLLQVKLEEILREAHYKENGKMVITEAFYDPENQMLNKDFKGNFSTAYIFGTQGAEVEIDPETGQIKLLKIVAAHDVGRVLHEKTIKGQIYGGVVQGLGYAFSEEYKSSHGRNLNPNFLDYKIFSAPDLDFPIDIELIETNDPQGPFGAKGVGEPGLVAIAPAIANAIYDAIGVRIKDLPITPEKILAAIKDKQSN